MGNLIDLGDGVYDNSAESRGNIYDNTPEQGTKNQMFSNDWFLSGGFEEGRGVPKRRYNYSPWKLPFVGAVGGIRNGIVYDNPMQNGSKFDNAIYDNTPKTGGASAGGAIPKDGSAQFDAFDMRKFLMLFTCQKVIYPVKKCYSLKFLFKCKKKEFY